MAIDPSVVINLAAEFTGSKAFKQADSATAKLTKSVKSLAGSLGIAFGTAALVNYGKASVKAFIEDDNAARSLGITLKNLGLETGNTSVYVNEMISNLEKQTGVLDDQLRPAMDKLLRATGSVSKATKLLSLALDISAGTGKDLTIVSQGLQKAYLGNNASLGRLGVGLSKAELASSSFEQIQLRLAQLFAGQASSAAESYAGQVNKLTIATNNAKEVIGKGIVIALTESGNGFTSGITVIDKYSTAISNLIVEIGRLIKFTNAVPTIFELLTDPVTAIKNFNKVKAELDALEAKQNALAMGKNPIQAGSYLNKPKPVPPSKPTDAEIQAAKNTAKLTKALQDQLKLAKAKAIFDLKKIQIQAALQGQLSEEERTRLLLMQAIENENIDLIDKYTKLLDKAQDKVKELQTQLDTVKSTTIANPFTNLVTGATGAQLTVNSMFSSFDLYAKHFGTSIDAISAKVSELTGVFLSNQIAMASFAQGISAGLPTAEALSGARYAAQGAAQAGITVTNNFNGIVTDPVATANQINQLLQDSANNVGNLYNIGTGNKSVMYVV